MKIGSTKNVMKVVGATLAVCSAMTMLQGSKMSNSSVKKAVKKTANKVANVVDMMSAFM